MRLGENIGSVYSNGREIQRVFSKGKLVWEKNRIDYNTTAFTVVALADTVVVEPHYAYKMGNGSPDDVEAIADFKYSINGGEWFESHKNPINIKKNDVVSLTGTDIYFCKITGLSDVYGNIMSLLYGDNFVGQTVWKEIPDGYTMVGFFNSCDIRKADNLILPATTLSFWCYSSMFYNCKSLTHAPKLLPATTLTTYCYSMMFRNCTSLTAPPVIAATKMGAYCCYEMFRNCTSLTAPPELPATNLDMWCYEAMFLNCRSLTTAPELPARSFRYSGVRADGCYSDMFRGCTSLTTAPELPAKSLVEACYAGMFEGCTSLTTAPELPASTIAYNCYNTMFKNCTSLTTAPKLTSSYLYYACYSDMFYGCTNLNYVKCYAQRLHGSASSYNECIEGWLDGVSSTGTFVCLRGADGGKNPIENYIPSTWTVEYLN